MQSPQTTNLPTADYSTWRTKVAPYENPAIWRSLWQLTNSVGLYILVFVLMYWSLEISYWLTLGLAFPAAGFLTRSFIILHDCGHGSFFKSQRINNILGTILGILTFTPFYYWRHDHAIHHATSGDLDRREVGDIWTMTVREYLQSPRFKRLAYRFYRNPIVMFGIGPFYIFLISYRFPRQAAKSRERKSIHLTNLYILGAVLLVSLTLGLDKYIMVQLPIMMIALPIGVWLFYVQHQYEGVYWERNDDWDYVTAALHGSSFYKLPKFLQWFSGNIGFHHIHHLSPRIPNYYLEKCYNENSIFQKIEPITFWSSFKSLTFRLWDEEERKLVGYRHLRKLSHKKVLLLTGGDKTKV